MIKLALIGGDVKASLSKSLHLEIAKLQNIQITYDLISLNYDEFLAFMKGLKQSDYLGINVTVPYKQAVIPYLDSLTAKAKQIGAVNTIFHHQGKLIGDNTDFDGFLATLEASKEQIVGKKVCILGTGGSAKAVGYAFEFLQVQPNYVTRKITKNLNFYPLITYDQIPKDVDIFVNCTPIGSLSNPTSPLLKSVVANKVVFDLVYKPNPTLLMSYAKKAYGGKLMLVIQAIKAQEMFFKKEIGFDGQTIQKLVGLINE